MPSSYRDQKRSGKKAAAVLFLKEQIASPHGTGNRKMKVLLLLCAISREATLFQSTTVLNAKPPSPSETQTLVSHPIGGALKISATRQWVASPPSETCLIQISDVGTANLGQALAPAVRDIPTSSSQCWGSTTHSHQTSHTSSHQASGKCTPSGRWDSLVASTTCPSQSSGLNKYAESFSTAHKRSPSQSSCGHSLDSEKLYKNLKSIASSAESE